MALTDSTGSVVQSYGYDPYGNLTRSSGTVNNPFQYASGWTSGITGFGHFGQRWYAPATTFTRWTQQDPVAGSLFVPTAQNRYAYASDDPVNLADPSGRFTFGLCVGGLAGFAFGVEGAGCLEAGISSGGNLSAGAVVSGSPLAFAGVGAGVGGGVTFSTSQSVCGLAGPFAVGGASVGVGPGATVEAGVGQSAGGPVYSGAISGGIGVDLAVYGGVTYTCVAQISGVTC